MRVFISWSGDRAKLIATALRTFLPDVLQHLDPWMSAVDIDAGARWGSEISGNLDQAGFGICIVTPENVDRPWLNFEAGALAKQFGVSEKRDSSKDKAPKVVPYMFQFERPEPPASSPLSSFQAELANEDGTKSLIMSLHRAAPSKLDSAQVERAFTKNWPELAAALERVPKDPPKKLKVSEVDKLDEVHQLVQRIARDVANLRDIDPVAAVADHLERELLMAGYPTASYPSRSVGRTRGRIKVGAAANFVPRTELIELPEGEFSLFESVDGSYVVMSKSSGTPIGHFDPRNPAIGSLPPTVYDALRRHFAGR